jgi:1-acyl-sn-glycerol-3-phosphate acyltransferase
MFTFFFKLFGWKMKGEIPKELRQVIIAVCPHNTWIDFFVGLGVRPSLKKDIGYLGKAELFKPPFGFIFKLLGGTPVYRSSKNDLVQSQVEALKAFPDRSYALAPEGTRNNVGKLKSGFYYMALGAKIPIVKIAFDFPKKEVIVAEPFWPSGDFQKDMKEDFAPFFEKVGGFQKDWIQNYLRGKFD